VQLTRQYNNIISAYYHYFVVTRTESFGSVAIYVLHQIMQRLLFHNVIVIEEVVVVVVIEVVLVVNFKFTQINDDGPVGMQSIGSSPPVRRSR
jgi:hypothetical protein